VSQDDMEISNGAEEIFYATIAEAVSSSLIFIYI
jgi:hypothetical protein